MTTDASSTEAQDYRLTLTTHAGDTLAVVPASWAQLESGDALRELLELLELARAAEADD